MRRVLSLIAIILPLVFAATLAPTPAAQADDWPTTLALPDGWQPEGIVVGDGNILYAGSRRHGGIYAVDLETGAGRVLYAGATGRAATGLKFDSRTGYIFASGAGTGDLHVYDSTTGANVASYKLAATPGPTFINDVIITPLAAYATDSQRPVIYKVPLSIDGDLSPPGDVQIIPLSGDYTHVAGVTNINGIEATPSGDRLILVQTNVGKLLEVNPGTGRATLIDVPMPVRADGILLVGRTLYAVQNAMMINNLLKIELSPSYLSGSVVGAQTHGGFDAPTTAARSGDRIYVVNGRFSAGAAVTVTNSVVSLNHWSGPID